MTKLKGRALGKTVIISLDKEKVSKSGIILSVDTEMKDGGILKEDQRVLAVGNQITDEVKIGDRVRVDLSRFEKKVSEGQMQRYKTVLDMPVIHLPEGTFGKIGLFDIVWIYDK